MHRSTNNKEVSLIKETNNVNNNKRLMMMQQKRMLKMNHKKKTTTKFSVFLGRLLTLKLKKHSKSWLSNIIQTRIKMILIQQKRNSKLSLTRMKYYKIMIKDEFTIRQELKVFERMKRVEEVNKTWMMSSRHSLEEKEVVEADSIMVAINKEKKLFQISLRIQM